jgi:colanic acid biosynthesis glycosyl transferase WcaI
MRILLLSLNYAPEKIGIAVYSASLCEALKARGHVVEVVSGKPYYPEWHIHDGYGGGWQRSVEDGVNVTRCPIYVPKLPTGTKRLLHHASFALSSIWPMIRRARTVRPDLVVAIAPSLMAAPGAWAAARLTGAKTWLHVQDFEVDAAFATGLIDGKSRTAKLARTVQRWIFGLFDRVSSIGPEMCAKAITMGVPADRVVEFRNWADLERVAPMVTQSSYAEIWGITTPHVALYSGNIANKQGVDVIVDAARALRHRKDLTFVICGEGPTRKLLEEQAVGLENVQIHDLQPIDRLNELLGLATIHLLPQTAGAADLVLPSKLTNMLASGRPVIVTAVSNTGLAREIEGCGLATAPEDPQALAIAIERLIDTPVLYESMARAARQRAERIWDRDVIVGRFIDDANTLVGRYGRQASV